MLRELRDAPKWAATSPRTSSVGGQQGVHDRELVVGLVLGVGVDDHPPSACRLHETPVNRWTSFVTSCIIYRHCNSSQPLRLVRRRRSWPSPNGQVILAIDQGTTNSKAVAGHRGRPCAVHRGGAGRRPSPRPGWIEQDAELIWSSVLDAVAACLARRTGRRRSPGSRCRPSASPSSGGGPARVEPARAGDRLAGPPYRGLVRRAVTEPDRRLVRERTGLRVDPMFSAPKMRWLLDHLPAGTDRRRPAGHGRLLADLAAHRRCGAPLRGRQRLPHAAVRHRRPGLERRPAGGLRGARHGAAHAGRFRRRLRHDHGPAASYPTGRRSSPFWPTRTPPCTGTAAPRPARRRPPTAPALR